VRASEILATPSPRPLSRLLPGIGFVLLVLLVYADPLFVRRNFAGRDLVGYNLPIEKAVHDAYGRGRLPVWISEIAGGRPLMPNPNVGALYPARPALSLLPFPLAMRVYPILHWILGGLGVMLLARRLAATRAASWIAAVTFAFSGVAVSQAVYTNYQPGMTLLPWVLWAFVRASESPRLRLGWLSLFFGLLFLAGDVVTSGLAIAICLLWAVTEVEEPERKRAAGAAFAAAGLGVLLAMPQIVATALWIPHTTRSVLGMKAFETFGYSVSPLRLLELVVPYPFGPLGSLGFDRAWGRGVFQGRDVGFFVTLYAGAFALWALLAARRVAARGRRFAVVLFVGAFAVAIPGVLIARHLPEVAFPIPLRYPEKVLVGAVLALSLLGAIAFDRLRAGAVRPRRWTIVVAALLAAAALFSAWRPAAAGSFATAFTGVDTDAPIPIGRVISAAFAEGGLFWCITLLAAAAAATGTRRGLAASLLVLTAVPIVANRRSAPTFREEEIFSAPAFLRFAQKYDPAGRYRLLGESVYRGTSRAEIAKQHADPGYIQTSTRNLDQYTALLYGRGLVFNFDFDHGDLSRFDSLRKLSYQAARFRDSDSFWALYSLRWGVRYPDQEPIAGFRRLGGDGLQLWDEHRQARPDIRLATSIQEVPGALEAANAVPTIGPGDLIVESGAAASSTARPGALRILEKTPERLRLDIEAPDPTWLFVLRGFWPYRRVLVDGAEQEAYPALLAFSAIRVPAGRHRVDWQERLPGAPLAWIGPGVYAAALLALSRRARRRATA
jgi:hypothetical protein